MKKILIVAAYAVMLSTLAACVDNQSQNVYNEEEVGKQTDVEFGVIKAIRHVKVQKQEQTGLGAVGGATAGGLAGSRIGNGGGQTAGAVAGVLAGAILGSIAEKKLTDQVGIEYIIKKENGKLVSIVQNVDKNDKPLKVGQHVIIQTSGSYQRASKKNHGAQYQRVLPADDASGDDSQ